MALNALDRPTMAFAALLSLALVLRWPGDRPFPAPLLLFAATLAGMALLAPALRQRGGVAAFLGNIYALILAFLMYTAIGMLNRAAGVRVPRIRR